VPDELLLKGNRVEEIFFTRFLNQVFEFMVIHPPRTLTVKTINNGYGPAARIFLLFPPCRAGKKLASLFS